MPGPIVNDSLFGLAGNGTYFFGGMFGQDEIREASGNDRILPDASLPEALVRMDVTFSSRDLTLSIVDGNENVVSRVTVDEHLFTLGRAVETLDLDDGTSINLTAGLTIQGAIGNTDLAGTVQDDTNCRVSATRPLQAATAVTGWWTSSATTTCRAAGGGRSLRAGAPPSVPRGSPAGTARLYFRRGNRI